MYQPIYFFGHHDPSAESAFVTIHTTITSVRMTRDHYIPVCSATDCSNQASFKNVPAGTVRSGQAVLVRTAGGFNPMLRLRDVAMQDDPADSCSSQLGMAA